MRYKQLEIEKALESFGDDEEKAAAYYRGKIIELQSCGAFELVIKALRDVEMDGLNRLRRVALSANPVFMAGNGDGMLEAVTLIRTALTRGDPIDFSDEVDDTLE
jgi:hypothetical protein